MTERAEVSCQPATPHHVTGCPQRIPVWEPGIVPTCGAWGHNLSFCSFWSPVGMLLSGHLSHGSCVGLKVSTEQCTVPAARRVNCHPQPGATQQSCEARGCTWCVTDVPNAPWVKLEETSCLLMARRAKLTI
uniref:P-type domain-containing protein n=1 Tax=Phasianus colchicus TaxID=9054 RepID=A0A669P051_PHACC